MENLFEVLKIIEFSLKLDNQRVIGYSKMLADKLSKTEGNDKAAKKILKLLESNTPGVAMSVSAMSSKLPYDQESRFELGEIIMPDEISEEIILNVEIKDYIDKFVSFYQHRDKLILEGLTPPNTVLLYGAPGCGKTLLAKNLSKILDLPIVIARLDSLISSFLGSTAKNIRNFFEYASKNPCILFLDEFDAVAKQRDDNHELGELKRVVNSLLQNIDSLDNGSILIAATNHEQLLDPAVWRRFSLKIHMDKPDFEARHSLIKQSLKQQLPEKEVTLLACLFQGLSGAAIKEVCLNAKREAIVHNNLELKLPQIVDFFFSSAYAIDSIANRKNQINLDLESQVNYMRNIDPKVFTYTVISDLLGISKATISRINNK